MKRQSPSFYLALSTSLVLVLVFRDIMALIPIEAFYREGRSIELSSALLLFMGAFLWFGLRPDGAERSNWHIPVILILMALRELDFDKSLTAEGILQLRLYTGDVPLGHKLIGVAVIALIVTCAVRLMRHNVKPWLLGLRQGRPTSWLVLLAGGFLVVAKSMDGFDRKLAGFGLSFEPELVQALGRSEELLELVMCMAIIQAVAYYRRPAEMIAQAQACAKAAAFADGPRGREQV